MVDIVHSVAQSLMDLFTKILGLVDGCKEGFTSLSLFWFIKGRYDGNQLNSENRRYSRTNLICRTAIQKWIATWQFWFQNIEYNFGNIRSSNPRDCRVTTALCWTRQQKSAYPTEYLSNY